MGELFHDCLELDQELAKRLIKWLKSQNTHVDYYDCIEATDDIECDRMLDIVEVDTSWPCHPLSPTYNTCSDTCNNNASIRPHAYTDDWWFTRMDQNNSGLPKKGKGARDNDSDSPPDDSKKKRVKRKHKKRQKEKEADDKNDDDDDDDDRQESKTPGAESSKDVHRKQSNINKDIEILDRKSEAFLHQDTLDVFKSSKVTLPSNTSSDHSPDATSASPKHVISDEATDKKIAPPTPQDNISNDDWRPPDQSQDATSISAKPIVSDEGIDKRDASRKPPENLNNDDQRPLEHIQRGPLEMATIPADDWSPSHMSLSARVMALAASRERMSEQLWSLLAWSIIQLVVLVVMELFALSCYTSFQALFRCNTNDTSSSSEASLANMFFGGTVSEAKGACT